MLLGGTSDAIPIARALLEAGFRVLLSSATSIPLRGVFPEGVQHRVGGLDSLGFFQIIGGEKIEWVVDATHPYAAEVSANAWKACQQAKIPYLAFDRPSDISPLSGVSVVSTVNDLQWAENHEQAAVLAFSFQRPVLLTIGVRNLAPYVEIARKSSLRLVARVLDHPASIAACVKFGLNANEIIAATGPFSEQENVDHIFCNEINVLVTKDSGEAGGTAAKISAARNSGCRIVVVQRPPRPGMAYSTIPALLIALHTSI